MLNHFVTGKDGVTAGTDITPFGSTGQTIASFSGKTISVIIAPVTLTNPCGVILTMGALTDQTKYVPIVVKDLPCNNGIVQVIGGVLQ